MYSVVKQYLTVDSLMDKSSHIGVFPLSCDEGGKGQFTPTQALKKQESFKLFHAVNQLLWDILRIFKWYKIPAGGAGEGNVVGSPIVLGQSKRMRLRKKVYKTRSDFQSDSEYGNYVKSVMKRGMRVKAIRSYDGVGEGDLGTFQSGSDSAVVPARVMWENYGSLIYFAWHNLEIVPTKEERGIYYESKCTYVCISSTSLVFRCKDLNLVDIHAPTQCCHVAMMTRQAGMDTYLHPVCMWFKLVLVFAQTRRLCLCSTK